MSAEKKMSGIKQKRGKSPNILVIHHDDTQANHNNNNTASHNSDVSSRLNNQSESSPNLSIESRDSMFASLGRKSSITSIGSDTDVKLLSVIKRSHTESDIHPHHTPLSRPKSSVGDSEEGSQLFGADALYVGGFHTGSSSSVLHRPVAIEEELYSKVHQLSGLVALWRKRWKQQKDYSDSLTRQIEKEEKDYCSYIKSMNDTYSDKLKVLKKELSKEILDRQKLDRDKRALELLYKRTIQQFQKEKKSLLQNLDTIMQKLEREQSVHDQAEKQRANLKSELLTITKQNEKLLKDVIQAKQVIDEIKTKKEKQVISKSTGYNINRSAGDKMECDGSCEYRLLFDLALQNLQAMEKKVQENSSYNFKCAAGHGIDSNQFTHRSPSFVLKKDPKNPVLMTIESSKSGSESIVTDTSSSLRAEVLQDDYSSGINTCNNHNSTDENSQQQSATCTNTKAENHIPAMKNTNHANVLTVNNNYKSVNTSSSDSSVHTLMSQVDLNCNPIHNSCLHLPLKKSLTTDCSSDTHKNHSKINRRTTWNHSDTSHVGDYESSHAHHTPPSSPQESPGHTAKNNSRSGFEGLCERRNGIIDMDREVALHLHLGRQGKKSKEITGMLKKLSFSHSNLDHATKDPQHQSDSHVKSAADKKHLKSAKSSKK